jgi:hypothetical protein
MYPVLRNSLAAVSLTFASFSFVGIVFASSYTTSFNFSKEFQGQVRSFDGKNIQFVSSYAQSLPRPHSVNKYYSVELHREKIGPDDYIGKVQLRRDSSGTAKWSSVGPGKYYVYLLKANDGVTLVDNNVKIENY